MKQLVARLRATGPGRVVSRYSAAKGQRWAVVIGWNALLSFFPIVLAVLGLLGLILHGSSLDTTMREHVVAAFPSADDRATVESALNGVEAHGGLIGVVGLAALVWGGAGLFGAIEEALDALSSATPRNFIRQKLMATEMILVFTALTVPLLASSSVIPALSSIPGVPSLFRSGPVVWLIQVGAGIVVGAILFVAIYSVVPNRRVPVRRTLVGALTAGVLLELLTLVFPLYFAISHGFAKYGQTFGLFFVLMNFFLLFGMITMIGGAVNAERDQRAPAGSDADRRSGFGTREAGGEPVRDELASNVPARRS